MRKAQLAIDTWDREEKNHDLHQLAGRIWKEKSGFANVTSHLQDGGSYHFTFALPPREKKKTDKKEKGEAGSRFQPHTTRPRLRNRSLRSSKSIAKTLKI